MAKSPSHRFGQIIGDLLEEIILPQLQKYCDERGLYLDKKASARHARDRRLAGKDPSHNGRSLRENPLPPPEGHSYRSPVDGYCIAYGRDRGETGTEARRGAVPADVCGREEYNYLWSGEAWSVNGTHHLLRSWPSQKKTSSANFRLHSETTRRMMGFRLSGTQTRSRALSATPIGFRGRSTNPLGRSSVESVGIWQPKVAMSKSPPRPLLSRGVFCQPEGARARPACLAVRLDRAKKQNRI